MKIQISLYLVITIFVTTQCSNLPKNWKVCKRSDRQLNECLKSAIALAMKDLRNGNTQLQIPPIEPFYLDKVTVKPASSGAVGLTIQFKNLQLRGLPGTVIDKAVGDYERNLFIIDFHIVGPLKVETDYTSTGRILLLPINGAGKCNMIFDNFKGRIIQYTTPVIKNKQKYLDILKTEMTFDTTRLHLNFKRNVNGNSLLDKGLNSFLNEHWNEILRDMKPSIAQAFGNAMKNYSGRVFSQIPYDILAPA